MATRPLILALFGATVAVRLLAAPAAAGTEKEKADLNGLVTNSPFGSAKSGSAMGANNGAEPFEFRAMLEENNSKFFSIYDTNTHRSTWVELNDPVNGFAVKSYDAAKESITVDYQGKAMTFAIKRAPAAAQVYQPPVQQTGPQPAPGVMPQPMPGQQQPGPAIAGAPSAVDQQRIQQIQEEIRRRRALRSQATPQNGNAGPQPNFRGGEGQSGVGPIPQPSPSNSTGPQPYPQRN